MSEGTINLAGDVLSKRERLLDILRGLKRVLVAFSGGIDSTVVAKAAQQALGDCVWPSRRLAPAFLARRWTRLAGWPN